MNFKDKVIHSLGIYKKEKLKVKEAGIFKYRGQDILKEHILPTNLKSYSVIENYRDDFYSSANSKIDFHRYYHHLNSSQALCINLFFPLILEDKLSLILELLDIPEQAIKEASFEKESDVENGGRRKTNFDFYICLADNTKVYFEIKYTEAEFGKAKNDPEHRLKFTNSYEPLLKNNAYIKSEYSDVNKFLDSYQIMRNLCHINDNSFVVFVYPRANRKIHKQAQSVDKHVLTDKGKSKFKVLILENVVDDILEQVQSERLKGHYQEFKIKYLEYNEKQG